MRYELEGQGFEYWVLARLLSSGTKTRIRLQGPRYIVSFQRRPFILITPIERFLKFSYLRFFQKPIAIDLDLNMSY
jgi:hypothetical protein